MSVSSHPPSSADHRELARQLLAAAFEVLRGAYVIPRPMATPYVAVGTDFFGDDIRGLPEFDRLQEALNDSYPNRFAHPLGSRELEFAEFYILRLVEAAVARCAREDDYDLQGAGVARSLDELSAALASSEYELVVTRLVSHLKTSSGEATTIAGVDVTPESPPRTNLRRAIAQSIPGAGQALEDEWIYDPPHALLRVSASTDASDPYEEAESLALRLQRFMLCVRLLYAATAQSYFEVRGTRSMVSRMRPTLHRISHGTLIAAARRTVTLDASDSEAMVALGQALDLITDRSSVASSFEVALGRFQRSFSAPSPYDQLLDLATALEAAFTAEDENAGGLTHRLCARAGTLLATDGDDGAAIFGDVRNLYRLRSKIVHGGRLTARSLEQTLDSISTVPAPGPRVQFADRLGHALDRMRDLVRRAILARLCLSTGDSAPWPLDQKGPIDQALADDSTRASWRAHWHRQIADMQAPTAGQRAGPADQYPS